MTIVIAWTTNTGLRDTGKLERYDGYNWRPVYESVPEAKAAVWLNSGTLNDLKNARKYAKTIEGDNVRVLVYPETEKDPLGRAKKDVL